MLLILVDSRVTGDFWGKKRSDLGNFKGPKWVTKAQGMYRVLFNTKGAEVLSQVVKAAAECVTRKPPLGKEDPSVSPWKSLSAGRQAWSKWKLMEFSIKTSGCGWVHGTLVIW